MANLVVILSIVVDIVEHTGHARLLHCFAIVPFPFGTIAKDVSSHDEPFPDLNPSRLRVCKR